LSVISSVIVRKSNQLISRVTWAVDWQQSWRHLQCTAALHAHTVHNINISIIIRRNQGRRQGRNMG